MEFMLATGNVHKVEEIQDLFKGSTIQVVKAPESLDIMETGQTFSENAYLKAYGYFQNFKRPVVADDSGLVVEALPEDLGVYSARFGGEGLSHHDRCLLLLEKMKGVENRRAYFICVLCCYLSPEESYFFEGRLEGTIGHEMRGTGGFGYDPLFHPKNGPEGKALAELVDWKQLNSHRALASQLVQKFFVAR